MCPCIYFQYDGMFTFIKFISLCVDVMVMLFTFISDGGLFVVHCQRSQLHVTVVCAGVCVVGPGFDSTSLDFLRSRDS